MAVAPALLDTELVERLEEVKLRLEGRLRAGNEKIVAARLKGQIVEQWEDLWIALLRQYEAVCDALVEARAAR